MPIICYGIGWKLQDPRTSNGETVAMYGYHRGFGEIDFHGWQIGVYALYRRGKLMYVGRSGQGKTPSISGRLVCHSQEDKNKIGKWNEYSWFGFRHPRWKRKTTVNLPIGDCISDIEALLVHLLEPEWNHATGRNRHMYRFEQA
jgi:hypothetical protein